MTNAITSPKSQTTTPTAITTPLLDQKIDMITVGLTPSFCSNLRQLPNSQNISTIIQYIQVMRTEINFSDHYRKDVIDLLTRFCNFTHHKTFKDISREDIIDPGFIS
jgi:hypothetical protein